MTEGTAIKEYQFPLKEPGVEMTKLSQGSLVRFEKSNPGEIAFGFIQNENGIIARRVEGKIYGLPAYISSEKFEVFRGKPRTVHPNERFGAGRVVKSKK